MPPQWISAVTARSLIAAESSRHEAEIALCSRAHAGLLKTKARLFLRGSEPANTDLIPAAFWWPQGHAALVQDWSVGDFSMSLDGSQFRAFGITFDLDGVLEMLPLERAARVKRELSVVSNSAWVSALTARRCMYEQLRANPSVAGQRLVDQCRLGFIAARAVLMQRADGGRPDDWTLEEREWDVPVWFWERFTLDGSSSQDWERAVFAGRGQGPGGYCWITLSAVHFARESLDAMLPAPSKPVPPSLSTGGRPSASFWDELWCAVWGDVYRGDLKPVRQADIERAMQEWVAANGHDASPSTIRDRARRMFAAYKDDGQKPPPA